MIAGRCLHKSIAFPEHTTFLPPSGAHTYIHVRIIHLSTSENCTRRPAFAVHRAEVQQLDVENFPY